VTHVGTVIAGNMTTAHVAAAKSSRTVAPARSGGPVGRGRAGGIISDGAMSASVQSAGPGRLRSPRCSRIDSRTTMPRVCRVCRRLHGPPSGADAWSSAGAPVRRRAGRRLSADRVAACERRGRGRRRRRQAPEASSPKSRSDSKVNGEARRQRALVGLWDRSNRTV
jgi:hypothetical protein